MQPETLDLLGAPLSRAEKESAGVDLYAYNVIVTTADKCDMTANETTYQVLAADSVDAINRAFELMFPGWRSKKPTSGMKIKVVSFERRK